MPCFSRKMALYLSTYFCILRPWAIISKLIKLDLGFSQASRPFYRKVKYREKVLEEFRRLPRFPQKMVLYSSSNFHILKPWGIISHLIRFDLDFWQVSKPFYRKLIHWEKVLEEFQRFRRFPRKMVLYLSTNLSISKAWAIISNFIRIDLGFWQASKAFYRKLNQKGFEEFQRLRRFRRKMVLYWSTCFCILKSRAIISNLLRLHLGFWHTSKPFYRKVKYREKVLEEFQCLPRFPRKIILYSSTNFYILQPWAIIFNFIRFHLGFLHASKPFYRKVKYREKVLEEF